MTTSKKQTSIPRFASYAEEASFWDTHSPEEFPGAFEDVDVEFASPAVLKHAETIDRDRLVDELAKLPEPDREAIALILLGLDDKEISKVIHWKKADARRLGELRRRIKTLRAGKG